MSNPTILVRNAERAIAMRKSMAEQASTLGVDISTPMHALQEAWNLFGDERRLIEPLERTALIMHLLTVRAAKGRFPLNPTLGTAKLLGTFMARIAGVAALEDALADPNKACASWPEGQAAVLEVLAAYARECHERGLIEPGAAARQLERVSHTISVEVNEPLFAPPAQAAWLASMGAKEDAEPQVERLPEDVSAHFVLLTGSTVIVKAVREEVLAAREHGARNLVVFAPDPRSLYQALASNLAENGIQSACKARVSFAHTGLGTTLHAVTLMAKPDTDWRVQATDFAYSPYSGIKPWDAQAFNTMVRKDSLMEYAQAEAWLQEASLTFKAFTQVVSDPTESSVEALQRIIEKGGLTSVPNRLQEAAAFNALAGLVRATDGLGCSKEALALLEDATVPLSLEAVLEGADATVQFLPMAAMDALGEGSVDAVIFADMTKAAFPVPAAKPATQAILERLGIQDARDKHAELRAAFATAERAARMRVTCLVTERNLAGEQQYSSFIYEEFVEAVSGGDTVAVDADDIFKVPASAWITPHIIDEADVVQGVGQTFDMPEAILRLPQRTEGALRDMEMRDFMQRSAVKPGLPVLSASQIEQYLQCPYRWFIARKVGVNGIDESMDTLRVGSFVHEVFRRTFDALADRGIRSVTADNTEMVQVVAAGIFDELVHEDRSINPNEKPSDDEEGARQLTQRDRCVAATAQDAIALQDTKEQILNAIAFMQWMPRAFEVSADELKLKPEDGIEYAGAVINGSVDRVDASGDGRFAVLDYKGSASGHEAGFEGEELDALPSKVQALIYAQCVQRLPAYADMTCVGALYLGYRAKKVDELSAGSYDVGAYDMRTVTKKDASVVLMNFSEYLNQVEELIAPVVKRMLQGDIAPDPAEHACAYCELRFCAARMAS